MNASETSATGTKETGFAKGRVWGPFKCGECRHFEKSDGEHVCVHPDVIGDAAASLERRDGKGRPFVEAIDCCEYQRRAKPNSDAVRSGMRG